MKLVSCVLVGALVVWLGAVRSAEAVNLTIGDLVVVLPGQEKLMKIDPVTGDRTTIVCTDVGPGHCPTGWGTGPDLVGLTAVSILPDRSILVAADLGGAPGYQEHNNSLLKVDPQTGDRTIVSSDLIGNGLIIGTSPADMIIVPGSAHFRIATLPPLAIALAAR